MCCRELEDIFSQVSVRLTCIVDHPEFATVCLNPLVLHVALAGTVTMIGERIPLPLANRYLLQTRAFSLMGSERPSTSSHCEHSNEYAMK